MSGLYYLYILVNAIIFIVISSFKDNPLSTGMLDLFFPKILYLLWHFDIRLHIQLQQQIPPPPPPPPPLSLSLSFSLSLSLSHTHTHTHTHTHNSHNVLLLMLLFFFQKNRNSYDGSSHVNTIYKVCLRHIMSCTQENGKSCMMHIIMESVLLGRNKNPTCIFSLLFLATYTYFCYCGIFGAL